MREQAEIAIDTADVIIFMTDVRQGLVDADSKVADMLRVPASRCFLWSTRWTALTSLCRMSMSSIIWESASQSRSRAASRLGLGDMLDRGAHFPERQKEEEEDETPADRGGG